jgi:pyruvate, orthophosphate dikinase
MLGDQFTFAFGCMEAPAVQQLVERVEKGELDRGEAIRRIPTAAIRQRLGVDLYRTLMSWAAGSSRLSIRTAVDRPGEGLRALTQGAEGIGPCRLESLFLAPGRIERMREMIMGLDQKARERALARLLPLLRADLVALLRPALDRPVTLSLLAAPLSAFLPGSDGTARGEPTAPVSGEAGSNPRPSIARIGIIYPELTAMQTRAILEAALEVQRRDGVLPRIEILIPPVGHVQELRAMTRVIRKVQAEVEAERGQRIPSAVGVELPLERAAHSADLFTAEIDFLAIAADLPQREAKGALLARAIRKLGKLSRPVSVRLLSGQDDPTNLVRLGHALGVESVACPPAQVPVARWAAAQAALEDTGDSSPLMKKACSRSKKIPRPRWMV